MRSCSHGAMSSAQKVIELSGVFCHGWLGGIFLKHAKGNGLRPLVGEDGFEPPKPEGT